MRGETSCGLLMAPLRQQPDSSLLLQFGLAGWVSIAAVQRGNSRRLKRIQNLAINGDVLLQGILIAQTATYLGHGYHRTDPSLLRLWVAGLWLSTLAKTVYALVFTQLQLQTLNLQTQSDTRSFNRYLQNFRMTQLFGVLLVYYVQLFFCWRTWTLSKRPWIPLGLALMFSMSFVCGMFSILDNGTSGVPWSGAYLGLLFVGDGMLSAATMYLLLTTARSVSRDTASVLERLSRLTMHAAVPGAICTLVVLITSQVSPSLSRVGAPQDMAAAGSIVSSQLLPKLYAFSAMWILNSRRSLRKGVHRPRDGSRMSHPAKLGQGSSVEASTNDSLELGDLQGTKHDSVIEFAAPKGRHSPYAAPIKVEDEEEGQEREDEDKEYGRRYRSTRVTLEQALRARSEKENGM
ncbi:unnamed protein product [Mycena citricolor]|uniref:DUF6534 domain-containing protein n=1 Tax=Mycena citricolor TaxID=2018698 RepID=A0AAD2HY19_9AGAR|nr:unnamed protein product [Mycena citricolor]